MSKFETEMIMKTVLALFAAAVSCVASDQARVRTESTDEFSFTPGGTIEIHDSFGDVKIEAWDRDVVELRIVKATQKKYDAAEAAEARRQLDRIHVTTTLMSADRLRVETEFPPRHLFKRPLRGKTNLSLEYHIKAPRRANLEIRHDVGEVGVAGIVGDIVVTSRIGEISLALPGSEAWSVDARARIGDVSSDFDPPAQRRLLVGASLSGDRRPAHRIHARVGIGEVSVRRQP